MSTAELQNRVIRKIVNIQDDYILEDLLNLIALETKDTQIETLSKEEKEQINIGLSQIANGEVFTNKEVEKDIQQWLDNE